MKTSSKIASYATQETKMLPPEKGISEADEAQGLIDFVENFIEDHGRYPQSQELPKENNIITYYFGSFEMLLRCAWLGLSPPPLRKDKKKRYCRYDNRLLPRNRWFFCNDDCERKFAEEGDKALDEASEEIKEYVEEKRRKMWGKCRECKEKCKIYLPEDQTEPKADVICRSDSRYEEASRMLLKNLP